MKKKSQWIVKVMLTLIMTFTACSGAVMTAQAAGNHNHDYRYEQRDDYSWDRDSDRHHKEDWKKYDTHRDDDKKVDKGTNNKANWAIGLSALAVVIAATK